MLMATAEALAQDKATRPARRIVVSIPDRKLAVMEADRVVKIFPTAVGAPASPSPTGVLQDRSQHPRSYLVLQRQDCGSRERAIRSARGGWGSASKVTASTEPTYRRRSDTTPRTAASACATTMSRSCSGWWRIGDEVDLYADRTPELDRIFGEATVALAVQ